MDASLMLDLLAKEVIPTQETIAVKYVEMDYTMEMLIGTIFMPMNAMMEIRNQVMAVTAFAELKGVGPAQEVIQLHLMYALLHVETGLIMIKNSVMMEISSMETDVTLIVL